MTFLGQNKLLLESIDHYKLLSDWTKGNYNILLHNLILELLYLIQLNLTNNSKQTINFNMKKLLQRHYVFIEIEMIYVYKVNQKKCQKYQKDICKKKESSY